MTELQKLTGAAGMIILDVAQAYTGKNYNYLIVRESTTISACTGTNIKDGTTKDLQSDQNWDGTLIAGDELIPPAGYIITAVTLATGSLKAF